MTYTDSVVVKDSLTRRLGGSDPRDIRTLWESVHEQSTEEFVGEVRASARNYTLFALFTQRRDAHRTVQSLVNGNGGCTITDKTAVELGLDSAAAVLHLNPGSIECMRSTQSHLAVAPELSHGDGQPIGRTSSQITRTVRWWHSSSCPAQAGVGVAFARAACS